MPAYAQAVASLYSELLFDGAVMLADANTTMDGSHPGYLLWAGAPNRVAIARKHDTRNVYLVVAAIMRNSNQLGNAPLSANATIALPRGGGMLRVPIRQQGSVFILDRSGGPR